jgi:hypothetical protein
LPRYCSILEICFSTLQLHAANAIQARPTQHRGRATWHLMQSCDIVWKCRKAGCMAILKSWVPQRPAVSGGTAVEPASNTSTTLHPPSSTFRQPSRLAALHTHGEGSLHPWASYHPLSLSVEKLKYGRCSSGASGLAAPLTCELCIQRLLPSAYFRSNLTAPGAPLANAGVRNKARLHITVARPIVGHPHI